MQYSESRKTIINDKIILNLSAESVEEYSWSSFLTKWVVNTTVL